MSKWCFNYDSGKYEDIDESGYSWDQHKYVFNWDDSEYRREEEEEEKKKKEEEKEEEEKRKRDDLDW